MLKNGGTATPARTGDPQIHKNVLAKTNGYQGPPHSVIKQQ